MAILRCKRVVYYSNLDEAAFFGWLKKISAIRNIDCVGDEVLLHVPSRLSDRALLELMALFYRFKVNMKQFRAFENARNRKWFAKDRTAWWHGKVFGR